MQKVLTLRVTISFQSLKDGKNKTFFFLLQVMFIATRG